MRSDLQETVIKDVLLADQPTKRFVKPEEIAALVRHLCSDDAQSFQGKSHFMLMGAEVKLSETCCASTGAWKSGTRAPILTPGKRDSLLYCRRLHLN